MITLKQIIADLPEQDKESVSSAFKTLYHTGCFQKFTDSIKHSIIESDWDEKPEELCVKVQRIGMQSNIYHQLHLLGKEYHEESLKRTG